MATDLNIPTGTTYINYTTGERYVVGVNQPITNQGVPYSGTPTEQQLAAWGYTQMETNSNLVGRYYVRKNTSGTWEDLTTKFNGLRVLTISGFNAVGEAVNIYTEQWIDSQTEDFLITTQNQQGNDVVIRKNVDLQMTFIVSRRYTNAHIDEQTVFNSVRDYLCGGDFYLKSLYPNKEAHVVCLKDFSPTAEKLHRKEKSYIMATITLHTLDMPTTTT